MFDVELIQTELRKENYFAADDRPHHQPGEPSAKYILLEGPAGVGKTELAKVMAHGFNLEFIRLQCYEGLDEHHALYEWNYQKQLLFLQSQSRDGKWREMQKDIFSEEFCCARF